MLLIPEYMHNGWKIIQPGLDICLFRNKILILSASLLGKDDIVRCFCCHLGLTEWDVSDDPWREHARHKCWFLNQMKGKEFIDEIQADWKRVRQ